MSEQQFDDLVRVFHGAQVDLPPHLRARLLAIPKMAPAVSFWDMRWMLPAAILAPAALWLFITRMGALWGTLLTRAASLADGLTLPALPTPSLLSLAVALGAVVVATVLGSWLYLRAESQATLLYARRLTGAR